MRICACTRAFVAGGGGRWCARVPAAPRLEAVRWPCADRHSIGTPTKHCCMTIWSEAARRCNYRDPCVAPNPMATPSCTVRGPSASPGVHATRMEKWTRPEELGSWLNLNHRRTGDGRQSQVACFDTVMYFNLCVELDYDVIISILIYSNITELTWRRVQSNKT